MLKAFEVEKTWRILLDGVLGQPASYANLCWNQSYLHMTSNEFRIILYPENLIFQLPGLLRILWNFCAASQDGEG